MAGLVATSIVLSLAPVLEAIRLIEQGLHQIQQGNPFLKKLVQPNPNAYTELARYRAFQFSASAHGKCWISPAFSDGRIYARSTSGGVAVDVSVPVKSAARWDPSDLVRRVLNALDIAIRTIESLADVDSANVESDTPTKSPEGLLDEKVVAETAMLLLCVEPIRSLDQRIREQFDVVAALLVPLRRHAPRGRQAQ